MKYKKIKFLFFLAIFFQINNMFSQHYYNVNPATHWKQAVSIKNSTTIDVEQVTFNEKSSVNLKQYGINNVSDVYQTSLSKQNIKQIGKDNYYNFNGFGAENLSNIEVLQQGTANSLQVYGTNSFMNGIKVVQRSNNQNIIIKNYK